jgi:hypothetical protein
VTLIDGEDVPIVVEPEPVKVGTGSAAELLGDWRAAGRDLSAAQKTASVAALAADTADIAKVAATETDEAARMSTEAAQRAEKSARRTAEAAELTARLARGESVDADDALERSSTAEEEAGERFRDAQAKGFPKT